MSEENYYDEVFARNYDIFTQGGYYDYKQEADDLAELVGGKSLLEVGIGTGGLAKLLLEKGFEIEGVEPSQAMIDELEKKNLGITVHKQGASQLDTGKQYDAIYSHAGIPVAVNREGGLCFDSHILDKEEFEQAMRRAFEHLKKGGKFLCAVQSGKTDNTSLGGFYRNESRVEGDLFTKTHHFKEGEKWVSTTVNARVWPEHEYVGMMESVGFKKVGHNKNKTWYAFEKP